MRNKLSLGYLSLWMGVIAVVTVVPLLLLLPTFTPLTPGSLPPFFVVLIASQVLAIPLSILGIGLGGIALIRQQDEQESTGRLPVIGVLLNGTYLFLVSTSAALALAG